MSGGEENVQEVLEDYCGLPGGKEVVRGIVERSAHVGLAMRSVEPGTGFGRGNPAPGAGGPG